MQGELIHCFAEVSKEGYRWIEGEGRDESGSRPKEVRKDRWLIDNRGPTGGRVRRYDPLEESPALCREFADLELARASISRFAHQYGRLGRYWYVHPEGGALGEGRVVSGESFTTWNTEVREMRVALELVEAISTSDESFLAKTIRIRASDEDRLVSFNYRSSDGTMTESVNIGHHPSSLTPYIETGNYRRAARFIAQYLVNKKLTSHTEFRLLYDPDEDALRDHVVPKYLLGALWIQVADYLVGRRSYRRCDECGNWFVIERGRARKDRTLCSARCKTAAYRRRRERAVELHGEGMTPGAIAKELGSSTSTVRRWLRG